MKNKANETLVVKSIFKSTDNEERKTNFNKKFEEYIIFCENKTC